MSAEDVLFTAAMEQGAAPAQGLDAMPEVARRYVSAWLATIDHGCGHETDVRFTAMPVRSALCPMCADAVGLLDRALRCGRCGTNVHPERGDHAAVVAVSPRVIAFLAFCESCAGEKEGTNE
jgi:hypothetical protein